MNISATYSAPFAECPRLVGREAELAVVRQLLDRIGMSGGSLLIRGDAGIGKSALIGWAVRQAGDHDMLVLGTSGSRSEARMPFAGLHRLLRPLTTQIETLPERQRDALSTALGTGDGVPADIYLVALASLDLLAERAAESPLLLVVEDAHWLDTATAEVLAFVARRVPAEPIVLLLAARDGHASGLDDAGLPELTLGPLDQVQASILLDLRAPGLVPAIRLRLLDTACGNPLALVELPRAAGPAHFGAAEAMAPLPVTDRVVRAFAGRLSELSVRTRAILLIASLDEGAEIGQILAAASVMDGRPATLEDLVPAEATGLVFVDGDDELRFRHPLIGAAVHHAATAAARHSAHRALADTLIADPDRSAWHRASALTAPDVQAAADLEATAERSLRRGSPGVAAAALGRAAQLSTDVARRGSILLRAADLEFELGDRRLSMEFLAQAKTLDLSRRERTWLSLLVEMLDDGGWPGATRLRSYVEMANAMTSAGESDRALRALLTIARRCWWGNPCQKTRDMVVDAAGLVGTRDDSPALLAVLALADPVGQGARVLARISQMTPKPGGDPGDAQLIAAAASAVWGYDLALPFSAIAVEGLQVQRRLGLLAQALTGQAWAAVHLAKGSLALSAGEEAVTLSRETGQSQWAISAQLAVATAQVERGGNEGAQALATEAEAELLSMGANPMLALVQFMRGRQAVARRNYSEGAEQLSRILDPNDIAHHPFVGGWALSDLVEASVSTGQRDAAERYATHLETLAALTSGPLLQAELGYSRLLLAGDSSAEALYQAGLSSDLVNWPGYRGRLLLLHGAWLRRQRRVTESRGPLRAARENFDAIHFSTLAGQARQELRASGEGSGTSVPQARDQLSPQDLRIAEMAASGLTNREIGQKLYLSHRTVASHLYRMFPKLGIRSRSELRTALS